MAPAVTNNTSSTVNQLNGDISHLTEKRNRLLQHLAGIDERRDRLRSSIISIDEDLTQLRATLISMVEALADLPQGPSQHFHGGLRRSSRSSCRQERQLGAAPFRVPVAASEHRSPLAERLRLGDRLGHENRNRHSRVVTVNRDRESRPTERPSLLLPVASLFDPQNHNLETVLGSTP